MASINECVSEVLSSHQKRKSLDIGNSLYQNRGLPQTASLQSLPGNGSNFLTVPQVPMRRTSSSSKLEQAARQGSLLLMRFATFKLNNYQQLIRKFVELRKKSPTISQNVQCNLRNRNGLWIAITKRSISPFIPIDRCWSYPTFKKWESETDKSTFFCNNTQLLKILFKNLTFD